MGLFDEASHGFDLLEYYGDKVVAIDGVTTARVRFSTHTTLD